MARDDTVKVEGMSSSFLQWLSLSGHNDWKKNLLFMKTKKGEEAQWKKCVLCQVATL